jgi:DNA-binding MarR family transcriptional regulator
MNSLADNILRAKFNITYSQFLFLQRVEEAGEIDVTRLANSLGVTKGAVSKRLDWFVERKLVTTRQTPGNAKRLLVSLSTDGHTLSTSAGNHLEAKFLASLAESTDFDQNLMRAELLKMREFLHAKVESLEVSEDT